MALMALVSAYGSRNMRASGAPAGDKDNQAETEKEKESSFVAGGEQGRGALVGGVSNSAGHLYGFGGDARAAGRRSAMALNLWESKALQLLASGLLLFYVWMDVALYYQVQASNKTQMRTVLFRSFVYKPFN